MRRVERVRARVSFADLQRMPEDGIRYELYDGELRVVPSPLLRHQIVSQRVLLALVEYANEHGGQVVQPPMDLVLSDHDVVQPDLMYFGPSTARSLVVDDWVRVRPDLAIEVISPSTARTDRGRKCDLFARYGVAEYWIVDPDARLLEVRILHGGQYAEARVFRSGRYESVTQWGLAIDVEPLFVGLA